MPFTDWSTGDVLTATKLDNDNTVSVGTDTARTVTVTHTWTASQTFTGGWTAAAACTITVASATALAVGRQGATDPALLVHSSTASQATGIQITGKAAASGAAIAVISSGTNENLTIDAKGSGTITLGGTSTGAIAVSRDTVVTSAGATAFAVGRQGSTDPAFKVDASAASSVTGISVTAAAAAAGVALAATSSGTNENLKIDAKGSGTITLGGTSTGDVLIGSGITLSSSSLFVGLSSARFYGSTQTAVSTSNVNLLNLASANRRGIFVVSGIVQSGAAEFTDLLIGDSTAGVSVVSTKEASTPAARSYSFSSNTLRLAMASGTYNVAVAFLGAGAAP